jgi:hypothetical protein
MLTDKSQIPLGVNDLRVVDGEGCVLDRRLNLRLGYERDTFVRRLIERNKDDFEKRFGSVRHRDVRIPETGKTVTEYWLTKGQALWVCRKSDARNADDVMEEIIKVFLAVDAGAPIPDTPWTDALFAPDRPTIARGPGNVVHVRHEPIQRGLFDGDDQDDTVGRRQWHHDAQQERPQTTWIVAHEGVNYTTILEWAWGGCPTQLSIGRENDSALLVLPAELRTVTGRGEPLLLNVDRGVPLEPILQAYSYFPHGPFSCNAIATIEHFFEDPNSQPWERSARL